MTSCSPYYLHKSKISHVISHYRRLPPITADYFYHPITLYSYYPPTIVSNIFHYYYCLLDDDINLHQGYCQNWLSSLLCYYPIFLVPSHWLFITALLLPWQFPCTLHHTISMLFHFSRLRPTVRFWSPFLTLLLPYYCTLFTFYFPCQ